MKRPVRRQARWLLSRAGVGSARNTSQPVLRFASPRRSFRVDVVGRQHDSILRSTNTPGNASRGNGLKKAASVDETRAFANDRGAVHPRERFGTDPLCCAVLRSTLSRGVVCGPIVVWLIEKALVSLGPLKANGWSLKSFETATRARKCSLEQCMPQRGR